MIDFLDVGAVAAMVCLDSNGTEIDASKGSIYDLTMSVATGKGEKAQIAEFFRLHTH
jgi:prophage maintenance system killer protein